MLAIATLWIALGSSARTLGTHAVGCVGKLARNFLRQQLVIPARTVSSDEIPSTIECVGLGRIIADPDRYVWMEGAGCDGARRQQRIAYGHFQIVGAGGDRH
jgi:hypothetical protein